MTETALDEPQAGTENGTDEQAGTGAESEHGEGQNGTMNAPQAPGGLGDQQPKKKGGAKPTGKKTAAKGARKGKSATPAAPKRKGTEKPKVVQTKAAKRVSAKSTGTTEVPADRVRTRRPVNRPAQPAIQHNPIADAEREKVRRFSDHLRMGADRVRMEMLLLIMRSQNGICVGDMSNLLGVSQACTSHHLAFLRLGGFVRNDRNGRNVLYSPTDRSLDLLGLYDRFTPGTDNA